MSKHPPIRRYSDARSWERSAETAFKALDLLRAETALEGVDKVAVSGSPSGEAAFDDTGGGDRDLIEEELCFSYYGFSGGGTLEDFLFRSAEASIAADGDFCGGSDACADEAVGELARSGGHGFFLYRFETI